MAAKMSVLGLILSSYPYPRYAIVRIPFVTVMYLILTVQVPLTFPVVFCETDSVFLEQILKSKY